MCLNTLNSPNVSKETFGLFLKISSERINAFSVDGVTVTPKHVGAVLM